LFKTALFGGFFRYRKQAIMFAIFCIPETTYIKYLCKYVLIEQYDRPRDRFSRFFLREGRGFTIIPRNTIYDVLPNTADFLDIYNTYLWLRENAIFNTYKELTEFCNTWFIDGKFIAGDIRNIQGNKYDNPYEGVANPGMDYPSECFEIHEIVDNKIVSTASICVCIPTKALK
jgi:hypothetical protein